jgi:DNA-binding NtrC family response regulator
MLDAMPTDREAESRHETDGRPLQLQLDDVEKELLTQALSDSGGNRTRAASSLGLSRYALLRRLQKHGLD